MDFDDLTRDLIRGKLPDYTNETIKDRSTGGHETPVQDVIDELIRRGEDTPMDWDESPLHVQWDFIIDWDNEDDNGHWEWTS